MSSKATKAPTPSAELMREAISSQLGFPIENFTVEDSEPGIARITCKFPELKASKITAAVFLVEEGFGFHIEYAASYSHPSGDLICLVATRSLARLCFDLGSLVTEARIRELRP